jgi:drug/metabolite transporter (DMT)-like permease
MNHTNLFIIFFISIISIITSVFRQKRVNLNGISAILMCESILVTTFIILITFSLDGYKKVMNDINNLSPRIWKFNLFLAIIISINVYIKYFLIQKFEYSTFRILLLSISVILYLIAGLVIFNEKISLRKLLGAIIIIFGIVLTAF